MNIHIPQAANDTPLNTPNITRLRTTVANQVGKHIIDPKAIKKYNNEILQQCIGDIKDFSQHFSQYIDTEGFNTNDNTNDDKIIHIIIMFQDWKLKNNHLLEHTSIVGNIDSIDKKVGTIQEIILNKLGIENDVIEGTDPWDRIAWGIKKIKAA